MTGPGEIAVAFHAAINTRDLDALSGLMTEGHRFIDSAKWSVDGKSACCEVWRSFFDAFPDYRNEVAKIVVSGEDVTMSGRSRCSDERLDGPALWRAITDGDRLAEWQVWEDTTENRRELGLPQ